MSAGHHEHRILFSEPALENSLQDVIHECASRGGAGCKLQEEKLNAENGKQETVRPLRGAARGTRRSRTLPKKMIDSQIKNINKLKYIQGTNAANWRAIQHLRDSLSVFRPSFPHASPIASVTTSRMRSSAVPSHI